MNQTIRPVPARDLLGGDLSLELAPANVAGFDPDPEVFPPGSRVFLSHLDGKPEAAQVAAAGTLLARGYVPVPHLGARNYASVGTYIRHVEALAAAGVTEALFLGGNPLKSRGAFDDSVQLLNHPVMRKLPVAKAYIAGYPEGHPHIPVAKLNEIRARKIALCAEMGLRAEIVSQFAFDGAAMGDWTGRIQAAHPGLPVRLGVAGVASLPQLLRFAAICGIGPSLASLKSHAGGLRAMLSERDPGDVIAGIASTLPPGEAPVNLHLFPFGGWAKSLGWVAEARA